MVPRPSPASSGKRSSIIPKRKLIVGGGGGISLQSYLDVDRLARFPEKVRKAFKHALLDKMTALQKLLDLGGIVKPRLRQLRKKISVLDMRTKSLWDYKRFYELVLSKHESIFKMFSVDNRTTRFKTGVVSFDDNLSLMLGRWSICSREPEIDELEKQLAARRLRIADMERSVSKYNAGINACVQIESSLDYYASINFDQASAMIRRQMNPTLSEDENNAPPSLKKDIDNRHTESDDSWENYQGNESDDDSDDPFSSKN